MTRHLLAFKDVGQSLAVLGTAGAGIIVGFFIISYLMKWLLRVCPRGTYFAIVGFIVGSMPSAFVSTAKEAGMTAETLPTSPWHWVACAVLLIIGFVSAWLFVRKAKKLTDKTE